MRVSENEHFRNLQRVSLKEKDSDQHINENAEKEPQGRDHTGPGKGPLSNSQGRKKSHNSGVLAKVLKMLVSLLGKY